MHVDPVESYLSFVASMQNLVAHICWHMLGSLKFGDADVLLSDSDP